jgi:hypothetical protein
LLAVFYISLQIRPNLIDIIYVLNSRHANLGFKPAFSLRRNIMLKNIVVSIVMLAASIGLVAQTPDPLKPVVTAGDAASVGDNKIVVQSKTGTVEIMVSEKTAYKKVAAAVKPDFKSATAGSLAEIAAGDKLTISSLYSADGKTLNARTVYYITKSDLAAKNAKESEEWRRRGIAGKVTAVNAQTGQVTIEVRGLVGSSSVVLTPKESASFLRYAPNSIRYDEALASSVAEVKVGDMIRALGDKSTDGTSFAAERVIAGAFQTIAGTVKSVDAAKNEIVIKNLQTEKDMTITVSDFTVLKKFPEEMAMRLAGGPGGPGGPGPVRPGGVRPGGEGGARPAGQAGGQPGGPVRMGMGGGGAGAGSVDDMIERFPNITAADLKPGDMIAFSSSKNAAADHVVAIKVLAGVEPFIRMAQAQNGGGRGRGGLDGGFSIPGLDGGGIGFP